MYLTLYLCLKNFCAHKFRLDLFMVLLMNIKNVL
eukprot:UN16458